jgi:hypothetical protein
MSSARFWHFWFGVACLIAYLSLRHQHQESRLLLHPLALAALMPMLYLGSALPDWDIWLLGIGWHRNPIFHSALPYAAMTLLWRQLDRRGLLPSAVGQRLRLAVHVGFTLGLGSHLGLDIVQYGNVHWIPGGRLDRLWLGSNAVVLGLLAWFSRYGDTAVTALQPER